MIGEREREKKKEKEGKGGREREIDEIDKGGLGEDILILCGVFFQDEGS